MSLNLSRPITKTKLSDAVAEELERMIREGQLMVGDPLPSERDLMAAFAVGRPSIREALATLSRKGMVRIRSGERTVVTRPSPDVIIGELSVLSKDFLSQQNGIKYFDQLRTFFESSLVRYAAAHATSEDLDQLKAALDLNGKSIGNPDLFKRTDINFHSSIARIPKNPIFEAISTALADWVVTERPPEADSEGGHQKSFDDHTRIFNFIKNRDVERASSEIVMHLERVQNLYAAD